MSKKVIRQWAVRITAAWRSSVTGIIECGRLLAEAKLELEHGEFLKMIEEELPFTKSTAQRLMAIARDRRLSKAAHGQLLPPSWRTLYELTKLPDEVLDAKFKDGTIHPEMPRKDVSRENRRIKKARDEKRVRSLAPQVGKYRTLVIDPPWDYEWLSLAGRAAPGYATMTHDELLGLDVSQWAEDNCHMYLWTTNNFMTRAVELMDVWGFQHKTVLTWQKLSKNGKPWWGLGSYFRNATEHVLFGVRGEMPTRADNISTLFEAAIREHSEKPEVFYDIVRIASHGPYGECFQREPRPDFVNLFQPAMAEAAE